MKNIYQSASALELAVKNETGHEEELLEKVLSELQPVIAGLEKLRKKSL
jgi:hypothetical protein